jgi:dTDP-4-dehydrorhamnose 3,5-epimerase-like enzyme
MRIGSLLNGGCNTSKPSNVVLMWFNKDLNTLKKGFLIWSNKDIKIKATFVQIKILRELDLNNIWVEGKNRLLKNGTF